MRKLSLLAPATALLLAACSTNPSHPEPAPRAPGQPGTRPESPRAAGSAGARAASQGEGTAGRSAGQPAGKAASGAQPGREAEGSEPAAGGTAAANGAQPERFSEEAMRLVQEGREIQREQGEGGAREALEKYRAALGKDPCCTAALWEEGWSYQVLGELDEAVRAWDRLRELDPHYPELDEHYPVLVMRRDQAAALAALPDPGALPPPEEVPREGPTVTLHAVGDVQFGTAFPESMRALPPDDGRELFSAVAPALGAADITFGNLETVLADDGDSTKCGPRSTKCYAFRVPTAFALPLAKAGFDVVSIANNHSGDFGEKGRRSTMDALDALGIRHSGPVGDVASLEVNGLRVGLVAFATGGGLYRVQDIALARRVVAELARDHDIVIVSFHAGAEGSAAAHVPRKPEIFYGENRGDVYAFAHAMVDAGADLLIGHGPHRLRGMEIYRGRLIAYSLGNFSTWGEILKLTGPLGVSVILRVTLAPNGVATAAELRPVVIDSPGTPRLDPEGRAIDIVRKLSREDFGSELFDEQGRWARSAPAVATP